MNILAFCCGLISCFIPNLIFYKPIWFLARVDKDAKGIVKSLFKAQFFKAITTILFLVTSLNITRINASYIIYGFLIAQIVNWAIIKIIWRSKIKR